MVDIKWEDDTDYSHSTFKDWICNCNYWDGHWLWEAFNKSALNDIMDQRFYHGEVSTREAAKICCENILNNLPK